MYRNLFVLFLVLSFVPAFLGAKAIGPEVSVYRNTELKWEDGAYGYHVMFKTLLENKKADSAGNPQADTCMDEATGSTYVLDASHVPSDAFVSRAFLVWSGAVPIAQANDPTDSEVTLSFVSGDSSIAENQVIKGKKSYKVSEAQGFEFDAFKDLEDPTHNYFTYRVDITDFFKSIHDKGRALGLEYDGYSLYGNYTMKDLTCASDEGYAGTTEMVAGWSIIMVYTSIEISPKKIYLYDGFKPYWHEESEITVTGFEFPTDPEIRITLNTHEGDPGLAELENPNGGPAIPEGLQVQGDNVGWLLLYNKCNPEAFESNGITTLYYTEVYNSVSSAYGWAEIEPTCIGGEPPNLDNEKIEYSMDADTFVMNSAEDGSYASHFNKGGMRIGLRIGANQDQVITNYMIVSVDTKAPKFDIPGQPEKVACTPANIAVDPYNPESKWCDNKLEHTFAIRVQNWGDDLTPPVFVKDTIPVGMEYVPGSTEYATEFITDKDKKTAKKWTKIPDNGGFPLESGFKVADKIDFCDAASDYLSCENLIMVRFRAKVKDDTKKHEVLENVASLDTAGSATYKTNLGVPVKLRPAASGCVSNQEEVKLDYCGGAGAWICKTDEDCEVGYICDPKEEICILDPDIIKCKNSAVTVSIGKNSPVSDVIFIAPQENLVMGQLAFTAASGEDCYLNLSKINLKVKLDDKNISLKNIKLVIDSNGNGIVDGEEAAISTVSVLKDGYANFASTDPANRLWGNKVNNVLFIADVSYKEGEDITRNASFTPSVEEGGITLSDGGKTTLSGLPVSFSKFQFEPADAFIVTKGPNDPAVPAKTEMNGTHDVLQLRVRSNGSADAIKTMKIKIPKSVMTTFGKGITGISIYEDTNNDGKGDTKLSSVTTTDTSSSHLFTVKVPVEADTDKFLTLRANINMSDGEFFQLQVFSVSTESGKDVLGAPVNSKEYSYTCDPMYEDCDSSDGCSCAITSTENEGYAGMMMLLASILFSFIFFTRKNSKNS